MVDRDGKTMNGARKVLSVTERNLREEQAAGRRQQDRREHLEALCRYSTVHAETHIAQACSGTKKKSSLRRV